MSNSPITLTRALSYSDRRSVQVFISDIRGGFEKGKVEKVICYCPESYLVDEYIPPNFCYRQCYLHGSTVPLNPGGPSIKSLVVRAKNTEVVAVVKGVVLLPKKLKHAAFRHSLMVTNPKFFNIQRQKPFFKRIQPLTSEPGNSVFICVTMVEALIKATLITPDKIIETKGFKISYEKAFKTEIGHNFQGCCHIVRVVTEHTNSHTGATQRLVTAYPITHFSPSDS